MDEAQGRKPAKVDDQELKYLRDRLDLIRKDCQWLVGLGAASIFGAVVGSDVGTALTRQVLFGLVAAQLLVAFVGATSLLRPRVDYSAVVTQLRKTLIARYRIRNLSLLLLVAAFLYLGATELL